MVLTDSELESTVGQLLAGAAQLLSQLTAKSRDPNAPVVEALGINGLAVFGALVLDIRRLANAAEAQAALAASIVAPSEKSWGDQ